MTENRDDNQPETDEASGGPFATIGDIVADLALGAVPAPVRRNLLKAISQLFSAAIDVPVAYLEGVSAEKRAETAARVKIIQTGGDQIAAQMNVDPEFARVAVRKFGQRIVREQVNLDQVVVVATRELGASTFSEHVGHEVAQIDDDWLNAFQKEACQKSSEDMQELFGKILAGEIRKPSSFSIKTIKLMGELDKRTAALFQKLASLTISFARQTGQSMPGLSLSLGVRR